jgi:hypothetical protein
VQKVLGDFALAALVGQSLQGLVLRSFQHLRSQLFAVQRVHKEILDIIFDFLLRALGLFGAPRLELFVCDSFEIGSVFRRFDHLLKVSYN